MKLRKLFPAFSCFLLLFVLLGISGCFGDDVTLKQCDDGSEVNVTEGEECLPPVVTPPPPPPPPPADEEPPEPGADSGECNLFAEGKVPLNGSSGDDVICGDDDNNIIKALGGEDVVRARGGNDDVDGGEHDDEIYGEAGDDVLDGDEGEDIIDGGPGNDVLTGGEDDDELIGGDGIDTVKYVGTSMEAELEAGTNEVDLTINLALGFSLDEYGDQDTYIGIENVITGPGNDEITGDGNANRIDAGTGQLVSTDTASRLLDGGAGIDTLVVGESTTLDGAAGPENANFENLEVREGTTGAITLTGNAGNNILTGGAGTTNTLVGLGGNDTLIGGALVDILRGGEGLNVFTGGAGDDCFEITVDNSVDRVTDFMPPDPATPTTARDTVEVLTTSLPATTQDSATSPSVAAVAQANRIVAIESYTHTLPDNSTETRTINRGTLVTVPGLPAGTTIPGDGC